MWPESAPISPSSILIVVVLPDPLGPRNPWTPPTWHPEVQAVDGRLFAVAGPVHLPQAVRLDGIVDRGRRDDSSAGAPATSTSVDQAAPTASLCGSGLRRGSHVGRLGVCLEGQVVLQVRTERLRRPR